MTILFFLSLNFAYANNVNQESIERLKNMKIESQRIPKSYLYLSQDVRVKQSQKQLNESIINLNDNIKYLSANLRGDENKKLLLFLAFTRDEIKHLLTEEYNKENGALMIDLGESLLDVADSLLEKETNTGHRQKAINITLEDMVLNLERATKYYIAFQAGFKNHNSISQMDTAVRSFDKGILELRASNNLTNTHTTDIRKITKYWPIAKRFYNDIKNDDLSLVVYVSTKHMEKSLNNMILKTQLKIASNI